MDKKKKIYYYVYPPFIYVVAIAAICLLIPFAVYSILKLAGVGNLVSYYKGLDITSVIVCLLVSAFFIFTLVSNRYIIFNGKFYRQRYTKKEIPVERMLTIRVDEQAAITVLYYADETSPRDGISFEILRVKKSKEETLIEDIRALNRHVSVERIGKDGKSKN